MILPSELNEVGNGFLTIMLMFTAGYFTMYLFRAWRDGGKFYTYENKTAVALLTLSIGIAAVAGTQWWWFHVANDGDRPRDYNALVPLYMAGVAIAGWGLVCLLRSLSRYDWPRWMWAVLVLFAAVVSVWFAM